MGNDFTICNAKKSLRFQIDPCNCAKYYNGGTYMDCPAGTIATYAGCERDDKPCQSKPWFRCGINIPFNDTQCRKIWPEDFKSWNRDKIQTFLDTHSGKESTTTTTPTSETNTITLVASLATFLVLAIIFILFLILWISFRRKRNSTPDDKFASSNVQYVNENNHTYEEIDETMISSSFCNSKESDKSTTTTNTRNISEESYEVLEEKSSPQYNKLFFTDYNEEHQVNNGNRNNIYHIVED
ncbi:uncharacterized protein LOC115211618 isoform X2 [Octopus sinensis]|uniref:Uncharacterized protein LOC115211618 isoform X2 n=1 Tax=Octopus sinensis TaxID=2607531 RepID=A0A6P7SD43_9MOLL|nr:uncharacterized protein LOC115211618 isoform X2 [Octopus sinensis]